jgi:hypothetical protein
MYTAVVSYQVRITVTKVFCLRECYASETWVLNEAIIKKLMIFKRTILRRIYGPTKEKDETWRIKTNEEFDHLIKHNNMINQIRAQSLSWFGNV